jgi:hypothetical protein
MDMVKGVTDMAQKAGGAMGGKEGGKGGMEMLSGAMEQGTKLAKAGMEAGGSVTDITKGATGMGKGQEAGKGPGLG